MGLTAFAIPEPATWAMMILGFSAMGAVLRRRRSLAV
ncbi:PEPxxWA-CTERM sorting domain-containing protein [uncultured Phenylobacterium sp.]|nr:PEPxxWA-CTERM sorting domain-containing protein [uncultured Phenylobacterium sp.]